MGALLSRNGLVAIDHVALFDLLGLYSRDGLCACNAIFGHPRKLGGMS
jgi:hypothetical protein